MSLWVNTPNIQRFLFFCAEFCKGKKGGRKLKILELKSTRSIFSASDDLRSQSQATLLPSNEITHV